VAVFVIGVVGVSMRVMMRMRVRSVVGMLVHVVVLVRLVVFVHGVMLVRARAAAGFTGRGGVAHVASPAGTRSMRITAIAAPKPLSMLTTVTPDAQLVSIPNKAVKPSNATP